MFSDKITRMQTALSILEDLNSQVNPDCSICTSINKSKDLDFDSAREIIKKVMHPIFKKWDGFSGNVYYPVMHPNISDPGKAFTRSIISYGSVHGLWIGEYGENRRVLLNFCIAELKKEINNHTDSRNHHKNRLSKYINLFFKLFKKY
jgi:hypothetical protein